MRRHLTALLAFVVVAAVPAAAAATPDAAAVRGPLDRLMAAAERDGSVRVIVGLRLPFRPEGDLAASMQGAQRAAIATRRRALLADLRGTGLRITHTYDSVPYLALEASPRALQAIARSPHAAGVDADVPDRATLAESRLIVQADQMAAMAPGYTGAGYTVAVLDTGIDKSHPFLAGRVVEEACYSLSGHCPGGTTQSTATGSGVPCTYHAEACKHGTHVGGIVAGSDSASAGVAPGASLMSIQVFSRYTGPECPTPCAVTWSSDQIEALERVYARRTARQFAAVNMSLGGGRYYSNCDTADQPAAARKAAIDNLRSVGIATIVASGNSGWSDSMAAPACISTAVSVGASTKRDFIANYSNHASFLSLLAPGSGIRSAVPGGGFASFNGTSMATPHVAGAWALLRQKTPGMSVSDALGALQANGVTLSLNGAMPKRRIRIAAAATGTGTGVRNDQFEGAVGVPAFPFRDDVSTLNATIQQGEPRASCVPVGRDVSRTVWYRIAPSENATVSISVGGETALNTLVAVWQGTSIGSLTEVDCNDDAVEDVDITSRIDLPVQAGQQYLVQAMGHHGLDGKGGTLRVQICTTVCPNPLQVAVAGPGTVTSSPAGINCPGDCEQQYGAGTPVALTARPGAGSYFVGWSGDCSGTGACSVEMSDPHHVIATFARKGATSTSLNVKRKGSRLNVTGAVSPKHPGKNVALTLWRQKGRRYVKVLSRSVRLNASSGYAIRFTRPKAPRCRIQASFAGDRDHFGSRRTRTFAC